MAVRALPISSEEPMQIRGISASYGSSKWQSDCDCPACLAGNARKAGWATFWFFLTCVGIGVAAGLYAYYLTHKVQLITIYEHPVYIEEPKSQGRQI